MIKLRVFFFYVILILLERFWNFNIKINYDKFKKKIFKGVSFDVVYLMMLYNFCLIFIIRN